jgi:hypothetical protein
MKNGVPVRVKTNVWGNILAVYKSHPNFRIPERPKGVPVSLPCFCHEVERQMNGAIVICSARFRHDRIR